MVEEIKSLLEKQQSDMNGFITKAGEQMTNLSTGLEKLEHRFDRFEADQGRPGIPGGGENKSAGHRFIGDESVIAITKQKGIWRRGELFRAFVGGLWQQNKSTITTGNVGTDVIDPARRPGIVPLAVQPLRIRDLMVSYPTTGNVVQYVRENAFTNAASPQVEASAKAESALSFAIRDAHVRTLAHWIPATKQVLDDMPMLMNYIDTRLMQGLKEVEELEILAGSDTGEHLNGIIPQATAFDTNLSATGDTPIDTIRRAILQAELAKENVDGIVLNPVDVAAMDLEKDGEGRFLISTPTGAIGFTTLWSRPVVSSLSIAAGTFLVGNFGQAAHLHDREEAVIAVSTEHSDFFVKNLIAIRCEERLTLTVERPGAFIYGSF